MAFVPVWFTGFEDGNLSRVTYAYGGAGTADLSHPYTGTYGFYILGPAGQVANATFTHGVADLTDFYVALWYKPNQGGIGVSQHNIYFYYADNNYCRLLLANNVWNGYVGANLVGTGTFVVSSGWQHIQVHIVIGNSGTFDCKIDGVSNFTYSGDTQPAAATTFQRLFLSMTESGWAAKSFYVDDIAIGTTDWPGDLRVDAMILDGDTATAEWTPSTGATNYGCIDERPASDTDYISTTENAKRSIMTFSNFDNTNKTPLAINLLTRLGKSTAVDDKIKWGIISGAVEDTIEQTLTTNLTYYSRFMQLDPNGNIEWTDGALDALQFVLESVIVP